MAASSDKDDKPESETVEVLKRIDKGVKVAKFTGLTVVSTVAGALGGLATAVKKASDDAKGDMLK
jgi:hypothetical protein